VHRNVDRRPRIVLHINLFEVRHEAHLLQVSFVILHILVRFRRALVIVKRDAWRNHIEHHGTVMRNRRLQHGAQLPLVAGERPANKSRANSMASPQVSIGGKSLITPDFNFDPRSAVAENCPLVSHTRRYLR